MVTMLTMSFLNMLNSYFNDVHNHTSRLRSKKMEGWLKKNRLEWHYLAQLQAEGLL